MTVPAGNARVRAAPLLGDAGVEMAARAAFPAGGAEVALAAGGAIGAGAEAPAGALATGAGGGGSVVPAELAGGSTDGIGDTAAVGAPAAVLTDSAVGDVELAAADAALTRANKAKLAAVHAVAIFRLFLRDPPCVFTLHNPFFVA